MKRGNAGLKMALLVPGLAIVALLAAWAANAADCDQTCQTFQQGQVAGQASPANGYAQMSMKMVLDQCGPAPSPGPSGTPMPAVNRADPGNIPAPASANTGDSTYDDCFSKLTAEWGQLGPLCATIDMANLGTTEQYVAAVADTVAAAACWVACSVENTGVASWAKGICLVSGGVGALTDLYGAVDIGTHGGDAGAEVMGMVGGVAGELAGYYASSSCSGAGVFTFLAGVKWMMIAADSGASDDACNQIKALSGFGPGFQGDPSTIPSAPPQGTAPAGSSPSGDGSSAGGGNTGGKKGKGGPALKRFGDITALSQFPPPFAEQALSGVESSVLSRIPSHDDFPKFLKDQGIDPNALAAKAASEGPAAALAGISGIPEDMASRIKDIEKRGEAEAKNLKSDVSSARMSGGGGGGKGKSPAKGMPQFGMFGMKAPAAAAAKEMNFDKTKKKDLDPSDGTDIWHAGYAGSIFQIVSHKLVKNSDRIETLEWVSPLNRALAGLSNKPGAKRIQPAPAKKSVFHGGGK